MSLREPWVSWEFLSDSKMSGADWKHATPLWIRLPSGAKHSKTSAIESLPIMWITLLFLIKFVHRFSKRGIRGSDGAL